MTTTDQNTSDRLKAVEQNLYDVGPRDSGGREGPGHYIAISGNTAAGKTTLIETLAGSLRAAGADAVGVSERVFHHRYLKLMFSASADFAFPIQLSFMLERHLLLLDNLVRRGRTMVMERSHLDDAMFVREHVASGAITAAQQRAYTEVSGELNARIPNPDLIVLMNPEPELSLERLARAEAEGSRPREFPSDAAKKAWVHRWYDLYQELHDDYRRRAVDGDLRGTELLELDAASSPEEKIATVTARARSLVVG
ncbi:deoxynucleoside kinase [Streptomyces globisporus]|uniref:deoxynucleoside kinase n=1 Tax=Streptomyces TaxID=1883 RepID=UPI001F3285E8|nr:deoxynucleoside kinase [Streptomyces sp. R527F]UIZ13198.1 deoxynucleoside kinase [Streptomyces sp. R527F]